MYEAFASVLKTICAIEHAMGNAMLLCQKWGYNGLKRKYRLYGTCLHYCKMQIECEMFDNHELDPPLTLDTSSYPAYSPSSIAEHLDAWVVLMKEATAQLVAANKQLLPAIGKQNCYVEKVLCLMYKEKCKATRWAKRFKEAGIHDLHIMDDMLHKKMKHKEEKEYPKWI